MFNRLKNEFSKIMKEGENVISRAIDKSTFKRVIYAGYLIASADNDFDSDEKAALARIVNKELPQFDIKDIIPVIKECDNIVAFDKRLGVTEILDFVGGASGDDAKMIMRICCFIGEADGSFDRDEKLVARDIAVRLKLSPSEYRL